MSAQSVRCMRDLKTWFGFTGSRQLPQVRQLLIAAILTELNNPSPAVCSKCAEVWLKLLVGT